MTPCSLETQQRTRLTKKAYWVYDEMVTWVSVNYCSTHLVLQDLLALSARLSSLEVLLSIAGSGISWGRSGRELGSVRNGW